MLGSGIAILATRNPKPLVSLPGPMPYRYEDRKRVESPTHVPPRKPRNKPLNNASFHSHKLPA